MHDIMDELTTPSLERLAASLEARLIAGTASHQDIDAFMRMQMLLGERIVAATTPRDPRD
jgi:hypothetical protein